MKKLRKVVVPEKCPADEGLPSLSHLHFLVLSTLARQDLSGRQVRKILTAHGIARSGASFYQMMAKLEGEEWVTGWIVDRVLEDYPVKEKFYRITGKGLAEFDGASRFYRTLSQARAEVIDLEPASSVEVDAWREVEQDAVEDDNLARTM